MIQLASTGSGGHPAWHLAVVALAAVAVFVGIKVEEHFRAHRVDLTRAIARRPLFLGLALCSGGAATIHAAVCPDHFREFFVYGVFFVVVAAFQAVWAVLIGLRPTRALLLVGAGVNVFLVVLWSLSRTFGLPIGPETWHPEAVSTLDVMATLLEVALVVGASVYLAHEAPHDGRDVHRGTRAMTT